MIKPHPTTNPFSSWFSKPTSLLTGLRAAVLTSCSAVVTQHHAAEAEGGRHRSPKHLDLQKGAEPRGKEKAPTLVTSDSSEDGSPSVCRWKWGSQIAPLDQVTLAGRDMYLHKYQGGIPSLVPRWLLRSLAEQSLPFGNRCCCFQSIRARYKPGRAPVERVANTNTSVRGFCFPSF